MRDFHCGLRGFDREKALALGLSCGGMEFATEIIGKFALSGAAIPEIPENMECGTPVFSAPVTAASVSDGVLVFSNDNSAEESNLQVIHTKTPGSFADARGNYFAA